MAATTEPGGDGTDPLRCSNAAEYALDRLEESDVPLSPADLAEEYDCTATHMRHTLADLVNDGEAERVARGKYVPAEEAVEESSAETSEEDARESEEDMVSNAEYQRQQDMMTPDITEEERGEAPAENTAEDDGEDASDGESAGGFSVGTPEVMLFLSLAAFALIVYLRVRSDGDESAESAEEQPEEEEEADSGTEVSLIE